MTVDMMYKVEGEYGMVVLGPAEAAVENSCWTWRAKPRSDEMKGLERTEKVKGHKRRR